MHYKTIVLHLLQQRPILHEQLRQEQKLLATLNHYAMELKSLHESRKEELRRSMPESTPLQFASEALELAIQDLEERLPTESPPKEDELLSLERAMTFVRRHTQPE